MTNEKHLIEKQQEMRFEIPFFYPESVDELRARQDTEMLKKCVFCEPAVASSGGAVVEGNLTFVFLATCTLDYFLQFMRLAFMSNNCLRSFLISAAQQQNLVAQALLDMENLLYELDWNSARLIWAKMIGIIDRALDEQHRSEAIFKLLKKHMDEDDFEWQMSEHRRIEKNMLVNIYVNCYGSEDAFFVNHLASLLQMYERANECSSVNCPIRRKVDRNSYLSFNVINGKIEQPIIAQYDTRSTESCGCEISKWSPKVCLPPLAALKHLKKIKIMGKECDEDESGIDVVCAGQRSAKPPVFINITYPPILLIANVEATVTTTNVPRRIDIQDQRYLLLGATVYKPGHFIGMVVCNDHNQDTIIDDLFRTNEDVYAISTAIYIKSEPITYP